MMDERTDDVCIYAEAPTYVFITWLYQYENMTIKGDDRSQHASRSSQHPHLCYHATDSEA